MSGADLAAPQAMVLAAGLSTRLWPLTLDRAKPAMPFLGRPLVVHAVDWLRRHGVRHVVVNTHYQAPSVAAALSGLDDIVLSHEPEILGTAGALGLARDRGLLADSRTTVIFNGKLYTEIDLAGALRRHRERGAKVTMILRPNLDREAFREVFVRDERVVGFGVGRAPVSEAPLAFTGIHLVEPEVLRAMPSRFSDTVADVYPPFIERGEVWAFVEPASTVWWEFSTPERYLDLHWEAETRGWTGPLSVCQGARIDDPRSLRHVVAWEGVHVEAGAALSEVILGAGVRIPASTVLERCLAVRGDLTVETRHGRRIGDLLVVPLDPPGPRAPAGDSQAAGPALDRP